MVNDNGVTETHYEGDWRRPLVIVCVFLGAVGVVTWIVTALKEPLTIALLFVGVATLLLGAFLVGRGGQRDQNSELRKLEVDAYLRGRDELREMYSDASRLMIELMKASARIPAPPEMPRNAQIQPPDNSRLIRTSDGVMVDRAQLIEDVRRVRELREMGFPAPRRRVLEQHLGTTDHPRIARALDYLAGMGEVSPAVDGGRREWIVARDDEEDDS